MPFWDGQNTLPLLPPAHSLSAVKTIGLVSLAKDTAWAVAQMIAPWFRLFRGIGPKIRPAVPTAAGRAAFAEVCLT